MPPARELRFGRLGIPVFFTALSSVVFAPHTSDERSFLIGPTKAAFIARAMEMHQLRYFEAVARCGSMMAAAASCHVSQPALSVQIRKLEEEIGAPLLVREARGVSLTPAGARTLVTARRILREAEQLRVDARQRCFRDRPVVRIAMQSFVATELLPRLTGMPSLAGDRSVQLQFRERAPQAVVDSVASGGSDLGLLDLGAAVVGSLCTEEFAQIPYACFCREDHPFAERRAVRLAQLLAEPLLLFEHSPHLQERLQQLARERDREFAPPFSSEQANTLFEFVAQGAGVAVLPASFAARAKRRRVAMRPLADFTEKVIVGAVFTSGSSLSTAAQNVLDLLRGLATGWNRTEARAA